MSDLSKMVMGLMGPMGLIGLMGLAQWMSKMKVSGVQNELDARKNESVCAELVSKVSEYTELKIEN